MKAIKTVANSGRATLFSEFPYGSTGCGHDGDTHMHVLNVWGGEYKFSY